MSELRISNTNVIPTIQSEVFQDHLDARFAVGIVAVGGTIIPGRESEFKGYSLLRGNVYAWQQKYMPVEDLNPDGTETDSDDLRSVHFALLENAMADTRVVGAMRLIVKSKENPQPLPIEVHYPEAFAEQPIPILGTEVARLISRHEEPAIQHGNIWPLFSAGVKYVIDNDLGPVYGVVKDTLARNLKIAGVPVTEMAEPKYVPEYNSVKQPVRVDIAGLTHTLEADRPDMFDAMSVVESEFVFSGAMPVALTDKPVA